MKVYEWGLYLVQVVLVYGGFILLRKNHLWLGGGLLSVAGINFCTYIYLAKVRPVALAKKDFCELLAEFGYCQASRDDRKYAARRLNETGYFADHVLAEDVMAFSDNRLEVHAGRYAAGGRGLDFGLFLLADLPVEYGPPGVDLDKCIDSWGGCLDGAGENAAQELPRPMRRAIRAIPFSVSLRSGTLLVDFDGRHINPRTFIKLVRPLLEAVHFAGAPSRKIVAKVC